MTQSWRPGSFGCCRRPPRPSARNVCGACGATDPPGNEPAAFAGYAVALLRRVAGLLFALLPGSVGQSGRSAGYGAFLVVLAATVSFYGWLVARTRSRRRRLWPQVLQAALTGGRAWRLKICPLGAAASACKTSDFRIPMVGAKKGGQTPPPATVVIISGVMNQN